MSSLKAALTVLAIIGLLNLVPANTAFADDVTLNIDLSGTGEGNAYYAEHEDADPFKGWVDVTVLNSGQEPWGDFHFEIFQVPSYPEDISNVDFIVTSPYEPTSSQSPLTWSVDNISVGATLDLYFYTDPVYPGETAQFTVYTDNTDQVSWFGVAMYPTPIPEPATLALLALGAVALVSRGRRA